MSSILKSSASRSLIFGTLVSRATATLPQTAAGNLFAVTGGRIVLLAIVGQVTTVIQAQVNATKLQSVPTTGSAVDLSATVDINALEAGGLLSLVTALTATPFSLALAKQNSGAVPIQAVGIVIPIGNIALNCAASNTGSIKWDLMYVPLDNAGAVTAA